MEYRNCNIMSAMYELYQDVNNCTRTQVGYIDFEQYRQNIPKYYKNYYQDNILLSVCDLFQHISIRLSDKKYWCYAL